jgi:hypothetical protein
MASDTRIGSEIGLHHNLRRRQAPSDELPAREFSESDIDVDPVGPRSQPSMHREHRGDRCARTTAAAVARVYDAWPRDGLSETLLTQVAVPEQNRAWADQSVIVQGLDDRHAPAPRRIVASRRDQREGIVEVRYLASGRAERVDQFTMCRAIPYRRLEQPDLPHPIDTAVVDPILVQVVAPGSEQCRLGANDFVLTAGLLIVVVNQED